MIVIIFGWFGDLFGCFDVGEFCDFGMVLVLVFGF